MNEQESDWVSNRLDEEPCIFKGCSLSELMGLVVSSLLICVPLMLLITALIGYPMMGLGLGVVMSIAVVVGGAFYLQTLKRGRPKGYYPSLLWVMAKRRGWTSKHFLINTTQHWSLGRTRFQSFKHETNLKR